MNPPESSPTTPDHAHLDQAFDLMALLDPDGRIVRINAAVESILGYPPAELAGRALHTLVHPDDHPALAAIDAAVRGGAACRDQELRWVGRDGVDAWLAVSARPCGAAAGTFLSARDVTAQRQAREEVRRARARMNAMLESIGDAFFAVDRDWRIMYANRKAGDFVGADVIPSIGMHLLEVSPDLAGTDLLAHYQAAMASGEPRVLETLWAPTGAWIEARAYPTPDGLSVYFHDVTAKHAAAEALRASEQRFRSLFHQAGDSIVIADRQMRVVAVNCRACEHFGYTEAEFLALNAGDIDSNYVYDPHMLETLRAGQTHLLRIAKRRKDGSTFPAEVQVSRFEDGGAEYFQAIIRDLTEREEAESRLRELATHDALTGLPNRALLHERVQHLLDACPPQRTLAVLFLDLDRFKEVNDSFGHELGDVLLCEVADRLRAVLRPADVVARLGGDEFVVAADCADCGAAARIAAKLLDVLTAPVRIGTQDVFVGASIGISTFPHDAGTKELLFQTADTAMYRAKAEGRNRYRFFEPAMTLAAQARMALEVALRPALARREFELYYQPRVDLRSMRIVGVEALLRWNSPDLGRVAPGEFIGIAEETGLIVEIGAWVLGEACRQARALVDEYARPLRVSVNVSARQLAQPDFVDVVRAALADSGLAPDSLELELTESALIEDIERTAVMLGELQALGVKLAVDDFGTGYSSLAYLRRFPIDVLKLDRSFVLQDDGRVSAFDFVKAFVDMAHALRLSVVAEGVETVEVLDFLRATACDEAQGYLMARPLPPAALRALLDGGDTLG
jgi:diguanylate cyclase (GGDEF)-like protein/PAS domain S-box-containing protein